MDNSPNEVIQPAHDPPDARALLELPALRGHPSVLFATRTCPLPPVYRTTGCPMDLSVTGAQSAGAAARPWMSRCASNPLSCPQAHGLARAGWRGLCRLRRLRRPIPTTGAHRQSSIHGLGARCKVPCCMAIAEKRRGHVPPTTGLRGAGVGPTKVLR